MSKHLKKSLKCPPMVKNKLKATKNITHAKNRQLKNVSHQTSQEDSLIDVTPSTCSGEISTERKHHLDQLLSKAIYVTGAPLSMVEHPLWVRFFEELEPLYKLSSKSIATTHLESVYNSMKKEITEVLKSTNNLHLQCDGWSNQRNEGNINFIIAKPEPVFVKRLNTLTNHHISQYIYEEILKVISIYGEHKFATIIGDNENNVQRAFEMVKDTHNHILTLQCVAHTLDLLCEDCLKPEPIQAFISIAVQTIKFVKRSQPMSALFAEIVREKESGETLKLPGKTRWGSHCIALKSLLSSKVVLQTLAVHEETTITNEVKTNLFDERFWSMTENCIKLLEPIAEKIMQLENNGILINEVYMAFKDIKSALALVLPEITMLDCIHKQEIFNAINRRISDCIKPIHCAAYMLDPRTQGVELDEAHDINAMEYIYTMEQMNIQVMADLAYYRAKDGLWGELLGTIWKSTEKVDPVVWWLGLCSSKQLSRVAVRILTTPCTATATGRSFNKYELTHGFKHNKLTTDRAAKISYIINNWKLLHNYKEKEPKATPIISSSTPRDSPIFEELPLTSSGLRDVNEFCDINVSDLSSSD